MPNANTPPVVPQASAPEAMNLQTYIKAAIRTESPTADAIERVKKGELNHSDILMIRLASALATVEHSGHISNATKRHLFYGRPYADVDAYPEPRVVAGFNADKMRVVLDRLQQHDVMRLVHAVLGIHSEVGEMAEGIFKYLFEEGEWNPTNLLKEEPGDLCWYMALIADIFQKETGEPAINILLANVAKLEARYTKQFSEQQATIRNLENELKALQSTQSPPPVDIAKKLEIESQSDVYQPSYLSAPIAPIPVRGQTVGIHYDDNPPQSGNVGAVTTPPAGPSGVAYGVTPLKSLSREQAEQLRASNIGLAGHVSAVGARIAQMVTKDAAPTADVTMEKIMKENKSQIFENLTGTTPAENPAVIKSGRNTLDLIPDEPADKQLDPTPDDLPTTPHQKAQSEWEESRAKFQEPPTDS